MRAPISWLKEFVDIPGDVEEVAYTLTILGMEVEEIIEMDGEHILDIEITPNRGDCLSILGLARELSAHYDAELRYPELWKPSNRELNRSATVDVENPQLCPRYTGRVISEVEVGKSPDWMRKRLELCDMNSINNIVDVTNYVLLELGQPLHTFDLDKLKEGRIVVRLAEKDEKIELIDETEIELRDDNLVIADAQNPVAIAGVMGGNYSEVSGSTSEILLESAFFEPSQVRRTSKMFNVNSDSSYRFERYVGYDNPLQGSLRACYLFEELGCGVVSSELADVGVEPEPVSIDVDKDWVCSFLGVDGLDFSTVEKKLNRLDMEVQNRQGELTVVPPTIRGDIVNRADVVEEIARIVGYDLFEPTTPEGGFTTPQHDESFKHQRYLNGILVRLGLYEVMSYSIVNPGMMEDFGFGEFSDEMVRLENPISKEMTHLRPVLVPSLLEVVGRNQHYQIKDIRIYELARVFKHNEKKPPEELHLGLAFAGSRNRIYWDEKRVEVDFYDLKGVLDLFFDELDISEDINYERGDYVILEDGESAQILCGDEVIGYVGAVSQDILERNKLRSPVFVAEISLESVMERIGEEMEYEKFSPYPPVFRDIAVLVGDEIPSIELVRTIKDIGGEILREVEIFDCYEGRGIPESKKSIAFSLIFQHIDRTLNDEEVDGVIEEIVVELGERYSAELRGK